MSRRRLDIDSGSVEEPGLNHATITNEENEESKNGGPNLAMINRSDAFDNRQSRRPPLQ
jgi:hypothetical protein